MPERLELDEASGFMDSPSPNSFATFNPSKKLRLLEIVDKYRSETGKWPDIGEVCIEIGTSLSSFYRHLDVDPKFKSAWNERLLRGEARLTSKLHDASHPIAQLAWLRRHFPERWNPEYKVTHVDDKSFDAMIDKAKASATDAEVIAPKADGL